MEPVTTTDIAPKPRDISSLRPDNEFIVTGYKQCRGNNGFYYLIKVKNKLIVEFTLYIVKPGNNIFDYLNKKNDNYQFTIKKILSHHGEYYFVINSDIGEWKILTKKCYLFEDDNERSSCAHEKCQHLDDVDEHVACSEREINE